ncbi:MAG: glycosyltransferase [Thermodesulfobacteriota bacterium]
MRLAILFDNFGPYHLARLRATRNFGQKLGVEVMGVEIVGRSFDYAWIVPHNDIRKNIITVFPPKNDGTCKPSAYRKFLRVWQTLSSIEADAVAIPGYQGAGPLAAIIWGKINQKTLIMMTASTQHDKIRKPLSEWLKGLLVRRFDAALVGGKRQREYAALLGIPSDRIFLGYDVVDNDYFAGEAQKVRQSEKYYRQLLGLPRRYFLTVSRLIPKKNLSGLIEAYAGYRRLSGGEAWDLVICGSGPLEKALKTQARDIPGIHFPGFKQIDQLPLYYGLASTFILASSHFEQWGLVVNEAMASGLPVLVSRICGCVPDLVREGENGFVFDPQDIEGMSGLMAKMSMGAVNLETMGKASCKIIAALTPETFAENLMAAIKSVNS